MTKDEALKIPDLYVEVTPEVEDAFYFLYPVENGQEPTDASSSAGVRLSRIKDRARLSQTIQSALRMIENVRKYGVACVDWCPD